jgi:aldose 1-epimerase
MRPHPEVAAMTSGGQPVELSVGDVTVVVDPDRGARARSWTVGGHELLARRGDDPVENGMYPMAPWAGRVRGNRVEWHGDVHALPATYGPWALHGTVPRQAGAVVSHETGPDSALVVVRFDGLPDWPWPARVDISWHLRPRELTTVIGVHALAEPFPVTVGWHPWFRRRLEVGAPLEWSLAATSRLERGEDHLPTGRLLPHDPTAGPFDDAFLVPDGRALVRWPGALSLDVSGDGEWYVVFDELAEAACVEPQSGPPDGLREGYGRAVGVAAPDRPHVLRTRWTMRDDPPGDRG